MQGCGVFPSECYGSLKEGKVLISPATVATSRVDECNEISVINSNRHELIYKADNFQELIFYHSL